MQGSRPDEPSLERSRTPRMNEQPPAKRHCPSASDNSNDNNALNQQTAAPSVSSQTSVNDRILMAGYNQAMDDAEARNGPSPSHHSSTGDRSRNASLVQQLPSVQKYLQATVTLRYGEGFRQNCQVHMQLLFDRSPKLRQMFAQSEELKGAYLKTKSLRQAMKALLPPKTSQKSFLESHRDEMAVKLIIESYNNFPLLQYHGEVRNCISTKVDELLQNNKLLKELPSTGGIKKREFSNYTVPQRLQILRAEAVHTVLKRLQEGLWRIKGLEDKKALNDEIKAAAKDSIFLPNADAETVGSLLHWIYSGMLQYLNAEHLCKCHTLAQCLGLQEMEDQCLVTISDTTCLTIKNASANGVSLQALLEEDNEFDFEGSLPGVVRAVFLFVMTHKKAPLVLRTLIVDAIANSADPKLVEKGLKIMSDDVKDELCLALATRLADVNKILAAHNNMASPKHSSDSSMKAMSPAQTDAGMQDESDTLVKVQPGSGDASPGDGDYQYYKEFGYS